MLEPGGTAGGKHVPRALEHLRLAAGYAAKGDALPLDTDAAAEQPTALVPHAAGRPARVNPNEIQENFREALRDTLQGYMPKTGYENEDAPRMKHDIFAAFYGDPEFEAIVKSLE